ncbi:hypothetical protein GCM10009702_23890 [Propioniferax innocua]
MQQAIFANRQMLDDLLGRIHLIAHADEPHHVTGDAAWERDEMFRWPFLEWEVPRKGNQAGIRLR